MLMLLFAVLPTTSASLCATLWCNCLLPIRCAAGFHPSIIFLSARQTNSAVFESGLVSQYFGPLFSVVSGGIATILVVAAVAWIWPEIPRFGCLVQPEPVKPVPDAAAIPPAR